MPYVAAAGTSHVVAGSDMPHTLDLFVKFPHLFGVDKEAIHGG